MATYAWIAKNEETAEIRHAFSESVPIVRSTKRVL